MTSGIPRPSNKKSTSAEAADMLERIVQSHRSSPAPQLRRSLKSLRIDRPEDVKVVLEAIVGMMERLTTQVEILRKAPVLQYDVEELAQAFERGGRQALRDAIAEVAESQRQVEANLAEIQAALPRPRAPRIQRRLAWAAAAIVVLLFGVGIGLSLHL